MFRIEPRLNDRFVYGPGAMDDPEDLLFVNADDRHALAQWQTLHKQRPELEAIMVADDTEPFAATGQSAIKRPIAFRKFVEILNLITSTGAAAKKQAADADVRILIVDDSFPARQFIKLKIEELCSAGVKVDIHLAETGEEAIEAVRSNPYDLVFLDVMLPGMDGYEACREIKKLRDCRVAMVTGHSAMTDKLQGKRAGSDHFVAKPPGDRELSDILALAAHTRTVAFG
jgi:twitching motility two-component system response regulator PilG